MEPSWAKSWGVEPRAPSGPTGTGGAELAKLKRRLLSEAVEENFWTMRGRRRPFSRTGRGRGRGWIAAGVLLSAGLASALYLLPWNPKVALFSLAGLAPASGPAAAVAAIPANPPITGSALPEPDSAPALVASPNVPAVAIGAEVFPLAVRRIVLDPGHGGSDLGTSSPDGQLEKDLALDIARRLRERLRAQGYEVLMTREEDRRISLRERARLANQAAADLFVSIHLNWIADDRVSRGAETYYLGPSDDPHATHLASMENAESGYSLSDTRELLERIYGDLRRDESSALAAEIQRSLWRSLKRVNPELENRGVKTAPFLVLVATEMPAILTEVSCLSNAEEVELLGGETYREEIAEALARGIRRYTDALGKAETTRSG